MLDCKGTTFHDFMQKLVPEISNLLIQSEIPDEPIYTAWPQSRKNSFEKFVTCTIMDPIKGVGVDTLTESK